jgi:hypothetical protein
MAKIKLNSLLADMRGRFGSLVISSNSSGHFLRVLKTPTQPNTPAQSAHRNTFSVLVKAWNQISQSDRDDWATYAARPDNERFDWFGDGYFPSSRAQFISLNILRIASAQVIAETPPTTDKPAALPTMSAGVDAAATAFTSYIDNDADFDASIHLVSAYVSISSNPGRNSPVFPYLYLGFNLVSGTWPWEIQDALGDLYGIIRAQGNWFMRLVPVSSDYRYGTALYLNAPLGQETP